MHNFQWNEYFVRDFITDKGMQEHLWNDYQGHLEQDHFGPAAISGPRRYSEFRYCHNVSLDYRQDTMLFEQSCKLMELSNELCDNLPEDLWFAQYEFVKYDGDAMKFGPHTDDDITGSGHNRLLTSVTMVEKTDDMTGGRLNIWPTTDYQKTHEVPRYTVDLDPWETVIFPAYFVHEATPVLSGRRTILISWAQYGTERYTDGA